MRPTATLAGTTLPALPAYRRRGPHRSLRMGGRKRQAADPPSNWLIG
jgi:hypothetical protein